MSASSYVALICSLVTILLLGQSGATQQHGLAPRTFCTSALIVDARLPPSIDPSVNSTPPAWTSPPDGWIFGNWRITYSSNSVYAHLVNLQYDSSPVLPSCTHTRPDECVLGTYPGQNVDLQTWLPLNGSNANVIHSAFGYDTPKQLSFPELGAGWNYSFDFRGTGPLAPITNTWEMLAWGYDELGDGYLVAYETAQADTGVPPCIDIESRSSTGPSPGTFAAIEFALRALGNDDIDTYLDELVKLPRTAQENNQPPFVCNKACQNNTDI